MRRNETTNDKIVRLFNEGWEAQKIADFIKMPIGSVNSILERRVEGYADLLSKRNIEANKARQAAKEEELRRQREKEEQLEAKQAQYSGVPKKPVLVNPDDFFKGDLDGMLVGGYKNKVAEAEKETVNLLTAEENRNLLTADYEENAEEAEDVIEDVAEEIAEEVEEAEEAEEEADLVSEEELELVEEEAPAQESEAAPATATQKMALFAQAQIAENDEKIESVKAQLAEIVAKINESNEKNALVSEQISEIDGQIAAIYEEMEALNQKIAALEERKGELENEGGEDTTELSAQADAFNEQISALEAENEQYRAFIK